MRLRRSGHGLFLSPGNLHRRSQKKGCMEVTAMAKGAKPKKGKLPSKREKLQKAEAEAAAPQKLPYTDTDVIMWSISLVDSYFRATGKQLFEEPVELSSVAKLLWEAPFACMSHEKNGDDYLFNYGNQAGLDLFERSWDEFLTTPSTQSAAADEKAQGERNAVLAAGRDKGAVDIAGAVRVTKSGRKFEVKAGTYWVVSTLDGESMGEAAVIREWEYLDEEVSGGEVGGEKDIVTKEGQEAIPLSNENKLTNALS